MSWRQNTSKPRQPRLRASCDGCFLAKIKCSKERPICSRCLITGTECGYSPSSRAGKSRTVPLRQDTAPEVLITSETYNDSNNTYYSLSSVPLSSSTTFTMGSRSGMVSKTFGGRLNRRSISSLSLSASQDERISVATSSGSSMNGLSPQFSWNLSPQLDSGSPSNAYHSGQRSKSTSAVPLLSPPDPWFQGQELQYRFINPESSIELFPNDVYTPGFAAVASPDCDCFNNSLQSLQGLHYQAKCFDLSPSFDIILIVNRRAVECCAAMLNCAQCMGKPSCNTTLMLLATIIGKVVYFYRAASQNYFGCTPALGHQPHPLPLTFGSYQLPGEDGRWLEMEILMRELRKVEQVFMQFQDVCKADELDEHGVVYSAVVGQLRQNLNVTFEVLTMRRARQRDDQYFQT